ncbi:hypothetical protein D9M70_187750 [compost metagenome]
MGVDGVGVGDGGVRPGVARCVLHTGVVQGDQVAGTGRTRCRRQGGGPGDAAVAGAEIAQHAIGHGEVGCGQARDCLAEGDGDGAGLARRQGSVRDRDGGGWAGGIDGVGIGCGGASPGVARRVGVAGGVQGDQVARTLAVGRWGQGRGPGDTAIAGAEVAQHAIGHGEVGDIQAAYRLVEGDGHRRCLAHLQVAVAERDAGGRPYAVDHQGLVGPQRTRGAGGSQGEDSVLAGSALDSAAVEGKRCSGGIVEIGRNVTRLHRVAEGQGIAARTGNVVEGPVGDTGLQQQLGGAGHVDIGVEGHRDGDDIADAVLAIAVAGRHARHPREAGCSQSDVIAGAADVAGAQHGAVASGGLDAAFGETTEVAGHAIGEIIVDDGVGIALPRRVAMGDGQGGTAHVHGSVHHDLVMAGARDRAVDLQRQGAAGSHAERAIDGEDARRVTARGQRTAALHRHRTAQRADTGQGGTAAHGGSAGRAAVDHQGTGGNMGGAAVGLGAGQRQGLAAALGQRGAAGNHAGQRGRRIGLDGRPAQHVHVVVDGGSAADGQRSAGKHQVAAAKVGVGRHLQGAAEQRGRAGVGVVAGQDHVGVVAGDRVAVHGQVARAAAFADDAAEGDVVGARGRGAGAQRGITEQHDVVAEGAAAAGHAERGACGQVDRATAQGAGADCGHQAGAAARGQGEIASQVAGVAQVDLAVAGIEAERATPGHRAAEADHHAGAAAGGVDGDRVDHLGRAVEGEAAVGVDSQGAAGELEDATTDLVGRGDHRLAVDLAEGPTAGAVASVGQVERAAAALEEVAAAGDQARQRGLDAEAQFDGAGAAGDVERVVDGLTIGGDREGAAIDAHQAAAEVAVAADRQDALAQRGGAGVRAGAAQCQGAEDAGLAQCAATGEHTRGGPVDVGIERAAAAAEGHGVVDGYAAAGNVQRAAVELQRTAAEGVVVADRQGAAVECDDARVAGLVTGAGQGQRAGAGLGQRAAAGQRAGDGGRVGLAVVKGEGAAQGDGAAGDDEAVGAVEVEGIARAAGDATAQGDGAVIGQYHANSVGAALGRTARQRFAQAEAVRRVAAGVIVALVDVDGVASERDVAVDCAAQAVGERETDVRVAVGRGVAVADVADHVLHQRGGRRNAAAGEADGEHAAGVVVGREGETGELQIAAEGVATDAEVGVAEVETEQVVGARVGATAGITLHHQAAAVPVRQVVFGIADHSVAAGVEHHRGAGGIGRAIAVEARHYRRAVGGCRQGEVVAGAAGVAGSQHGTVAAGGQGAAFDEATEVAGDAVAEIVVDQGIDVAEAGRVAMGDGEGGAGNVHRAVDHHLVVLGARRGAVDLDRQGTARAHHQVTVHRQGAGAIARRQGAAALDSHIAAQGATTGQGGPIAHSGRTGGGAVHRQGTGGNGGGTRVVVASRQGQRAAAGLGQGAATADRTAQADSQTGTYRDTAGARPQRDRIVDGPGAGDRQRAVVQLHSPAAQIGVAGDRNRAAAQHLHSPGLSTVGARQREGAAAIQRQGAGTGDGAGEGAAGAVDADRQRGSAKGHGAGAGQGVDGFAGSDRQGRAGRHRHRRVVVQRAADAVERQPARRHVGGAGVAVVAGQRQRAAAQLGDAEPRARDHTGIAGAGVVAASGQRGVEYHAAGTCEGADSLGGRDGQRGAGRLRHRTAVAERRAAAQGQPAGCEVDGTTVGVAAGKGQRAGAGLGQGAAAAECAADGGIGAGGNGRSGGQRDRIIDRGGPADAQGAAVQRDRAGTQVVVVGDRQRTAGDGGVAAMARLVAAVGQDQRAGVGLVQAERPIQGAVESQGAAGGRADVGSPRQRHCAAYGSAAARQV